MTHSWGEGHPYRMDLPGMTNPPPHPHPPPPPPTPPRPPHPPPPTPPPPTQPTPTPPPTTHPHPPPPPHPAHPHPTPPAPPPKGNFFAIACLPILASRVSVGEDHQSAMCQRQPHMSCTTNCGSPRLLCVTTDGLLCQPPHHIVSPAATLSHCTLSHRRPHCLTATLCHHRRLSIGHIVLPPPHCFTAAAIAHRAAACGPTSTSAHHCQPPFVQSGGITMWWH